QGASQLTKRPLPLALLGASRSCRNLGFEAPRSGRKCLGIPCPAPAASPHFKVIIIHPASHPSSHRVTPSPASQPVIETFTLPSQIRTEPAKKLSGGPCPRGNSLCTHPPHPSPTNA